MENLAIVDLGSNSARMAVTEISPDGKEYTFDQIDGLINDFMKGKVK